MPHLRQVRAGWFPFDGKPDSNRKNFSGSDSAGETPVPIPNTAVKPCSADGTASLRGWESRTPPGVYWKPSFRNEEGFLFDINMVGNIILI